MRVLVVFLNQDPWICVQSTDNLLGVDLRLQCREGRRRDCVCVVVLLRCDHVQFVLRCYCGVTMCSLCCGAIVV